MAHVLFTWELGDNFGHLVSYRGLVASLLADGHRVSFCAKRLDNARTVYGDSAVALRQAPVPNDDASPVCRGLHTFCEILLNNGFHDAAVVARRVAARQDIFAADPPDFLIMDYSPTAMLAARREGLAGAVAGNGFTIPPRVAPLPPLRYWEPADRGRIEASEARLVAIFNEVAGAARPLAAFHEFYLPFVELLRCFRELDHYPRRDGSEYLGTFPIGDYGIAPPWPDGEGDRVFGYLQPSATSEAVLQALAARGNPACVYCPEYFRRGIDPPPADNIRYLDQPMQIGQAVRE
ncbi:MAG: hypothetical protein KJO38_08495, partial [Gammaproteobacteria bacterium]|nr:hypothetical protein [Gammaproteobacteria bacterium]